MRHTKAWTLLILIFACLTTGCREFTSVTKTWSGKNSQCPGTAAPVPTTFAVSKVYATSDLELQAGSVWTAIVDHSCERAVGLQRAAKQSPLIAAKHGLANRILEAAGIGQSSLLAVEDKLPRVGERSHSIVLNQNYKLSEVQAEIDSSVCIKGFAKSLVMYPVAVPNDPGFGQQAHHRILESAAAWDIFFHPESGIKTDMVIAVIDSGLDLEHEDIRDHLWKNVDEIPGNGLDDDRNGYVDDYYGYNFAQKIPDPSHSGNWNGNFHGTHVAGLAAAVADNEKGITGVMGRQIRIMPLNIFGADPGTQSEYIDNAIRYAADNGANVINLSVGGQGESQTTAAALEYAINKGVAVVAAAGNSTANIDQIPFSPAGYSARFAGMLSVGSTDAVTRNRSSFSNFGPMTVEIAAPGSNGIVSTMPNNQYGAQQGTSMASPITAGAAALTMAFIQSRSGRRATPGEVEQALLNGSETIPALEVFFKNGKHLQLKKLADSLNQSYPFNPPKPSPSPSPQPSNGTGACP